MKKTITALVLVLAFAFAGTATAATQWTTFHIVKDLSLSYESWRASGLINVTNAQQGGSYEGEPTGSVNIVSTAAWPDWTPGWDIVLAKIKNTSTTSFVTGRIKLHLTATNSTADGDTTFYDGRFVVRWGRGVYSGLSGKGTMTGYHNDIYAEDVFDLGGNLSR